MAPNSDDDAALMAFPDASSLTCTSERATLTIDVFGNADSAYYFDVQSSYISCPEELTDQISSSNARTVCLWADVESWTQRGHSASNWVRLSCGCQTQEAKLDGYGFLNDVGPTGD